MRAQAAQATLVTVLLAGAALAPCSFSAPIRSAPQQPSLHARAESGMAKVQGLLVSGLHRVVLSHGAALLHDGAEGLDGGKAQLRLLLSDGPMEPDHLLGPLPELRLQEAARSGSPRAVFVSFDPANPDQLQITPLVAPGPDAAGAISSLSITRSGEPGTGAFDTFAFLPQHLRAAFTYSRETSFPAAPSDIRSLSFQVDLPVEREPAVTARVEGGKAVRATPQGKLALARARSMTTLDSAGLARLRAASPASVPPLPPGSPEDDLLQMLRSLAADQLRALGGESLLLVERGDRAVLVISEGEGLRSWIRFRRSNGSWQVD